MMSRAGFLFVLAWLSLPKHVASVREVYNIGEEIMLSSDDTHNMAYMVFMQKMQKPEMMLTIIPGCNSGCWIHGPMLCLDTACCVDPTAAEKASCATSLQAEATHVCEGPEDRSCVIEPKLGRIPLPETKAVEGLRMYAKLFPEEESKLKRTNSELLGVLTSGIDFEKINMSTNTALFDEDIFMAYIEEENHAFDSSLIEVSSNLSVHLSECHKSIVSLSVLTISIGFAAMDIGSAWNKRIAIQQLSKFSSWGSKFDKVFSRAIRPLSVGITPWQKSKAIFQLFLYLHNTVGHRIWAIIHASLTNLWWWEVAATVTQVSCTIVAMLAPSGTAMIAKLISLVVSLAQWGLELTKCLEKC